MSAAGSKPASGTPSRAAQRCTATARTCAYRTTNPGLSQVRGRSGHRTAELPGRAVPAGAGRPGAPATMSRTTSPGKSTVMSSMPSGAVVTSRTPGTSRSRAASSAARSGARSAAAEA